MIYKNKIHLSEVITCHYMLQDLCVLHTVHIRGSDHCHCDGIYYEQTSTERVALWGGFSGLVSVHCVLAELWWRKKWNKINKRSEFQGNFHCLYMYQSYLVKTLPTVTHWSNYLWYTIQPIMSVGGQQCGPTSSAVFAYACCQLSEMLPGAGSYQQTKLTQSSCTRRSKVENLVWSPTKERKW